LSPARTTQKTEQLRSVQCLRALAALFVVGFHSTLLLHENFFPNVMPWNNGNAGVDLFFVISGFIMIVSSQPLLHEPNGWRRFIGLRLVRIVPMYWLATLAKLLLVAVLPGAARHTHLTEWNTIASFLFLPSFDGAGIVRPVLPIGWTLSFEMLFYLLFTAALFFSLDPVRAVGAAMVVLALLSLLVQADWPAITTLASPYVLEFVFGLIIGRAFLTKRLRQASLGWAALIGAAGLGCLAVVPAEGAWERAAIWGGAASAALCGGLMCERDLGHRLPKLLVQTGEASYSLYLSHGFVLPVIGLLLAQSAFTGPALAVVVVVSCLGLSTLTALTIYYRVEAPMTRRLRRMVPNPQGIGAARNP
jgi:exopolysaccharide production protein ExoZ